MSSVVTVLFKLGGITTCENGAGAGGGLLSASRFPLALVEPELGPVPLRGASFELDGSESEVSGLDLGSDDRRFDDDC